MRGGSGRHKGRTPPGPPRRAVPGLLWKLATDRLGLLSSASAKYGDAVRIAMGPKTLYLFNHPEHAKQVLADNAGNYTKGIGYLQAKRALGDGLLTSDGEVWRRQRATVRPAFQNRRIAEQDGVIAEEADRLVGRLRAAAGSGPVDVLDEVTGFTLGVLGRALLDADLSSFGSIGDSFEAVQDQAMFEMETMGAVPMWLPLPRQRRFRRARAELKRTVDTLVSARADGFAEDADDVLTRLILARRREPDSRVAEQRLRDELVTLLLAGHETTASTLGWAFHLIDRHPLVADRLHEEAVRVLGDRLPTHADLRELTYTNAVLMETTRLRPPVWILTCVAVADDEVGGYHVPAGSDVLICPYTLHRNPEFWDRPDVFDPERFMPERAADRPRYAHLPFGAGPRFCVGSHLGLMEAMFVLAMVARELRLNTVPGHRVVGQPMLSLRIKDGLPMTITKANVSEPAGIAGG